jgi:ankyrin repeat protein
MLETNRRVSIAVLIALAFLELACGNPREKARARLGQMNVTYSATSFVERARDGDVFAVRYFLDAGMNPDAADSDGKTPLVAAAEKGRLEIVQLLLNKGAKVDLRDGKYRATPLIWASLGGHEAIAELLLARGADPKIKEQKQGVDALIAASARGRTKLVKLLLDHGANPKTVDKEGKTAVMWAAKAGDSAAVKLLTDAGAPWDREPKPSVASKQ